MTEYTRRQLRDITQHALHRLANSPEYLAGQETRDMAQAALDQMRHHDQPQPREVIWRMQVQPRLWVVVEDSTNVLLEVRGGLNDSELIARTEPVNKAELDSALVVAAVTAEQARDDAEQARLDGLREKLAERRRTRD